jgi:hypothetical protein
MPRVKQNHTVLFVIGLFREMKPADRRLLMATLTDETLDLAFPAAEAPKPKSAKRKEAQPPTIIQESKTA